ncbi:hypothetical protein [Paraburkholderia sacchari]|nr:hypothetical protein [Paraburkholderia sacchari]
MATGFRRPSLVALFAGAFRFNLSMRGEPYLLWRAVDEQGAEWSKP